MEEAPEKRVDKPNCNSDRSIVLLCRDQMHSGSFHGQLVVLCFFILFLSKRLITMQWWASEPHLQAQSRVHLKTQGYKNGFFFCHTVRLESFLFLWIVIIFSPARYLQLPAEMNCFEEVSFSYLCTWDCSLQARSPLPLCSFQNWDSKLTLVEYHTTFNTPNVSSWEFLFRQ